MSLPTTAQESPQERSGGTESATSGPLTVRLATDPINILIVDDEPRNLTVLETVLDDPGYRLVRAESADQALLALVAKDFALLILDVRMPVMTGFELATLIRQRKKTEQVPIIFLTAYYNEDQHVLEGYGTGAVDYLHKPVNPIILRSKVAVFADLHRKNRALEFTNRALVAEVAERREAQAKLRDLNDSLEVRVAERTAKLLESDRQKDNFIATLAHELRNPLAPIRNALTFMRSQETDDPRLRWCRDVIDRQISQMTRLLEDLLDVSRITRSKVTLQCEVLQIGDVIEQALEVARPFIDQAGHSLEMQLPATPISLYADAMRLAQVISNLLINAAKYTPPSGKITLSARQDHGDVVLTIKDTGVGIAPEYLPRLFEMFSQVPSSRGEAHGGLGIGLALARGLVELHGGELSGHSEGIDKGSEFTVRLPLRQAPATSAALVKPAPAHSSPVQKCRVLVIDDLRDNADSLGMVLQAAGHDVQVAYGGEQGLVAAEQFRPHIALIDLGMPGMDGYEVSRRIRACPWGAAVLLVAQTGWGQEFDRRRTEAAGFDNHLVKPVSWDAVEPLLRKAAARIAE